MEETLKLSVSELTQMLKQTLESSFFGLLIEGEVSNFSASSSGHWYFNLKDKDSMISATMWRNSVMRLGFVPKDGDKVIVKGNISVYPPRGTYQINCTSMRLCGEGDILAMLEERKRHYAELGWFENKKPIPSRPERVAVITSGTGAALHDILQVTGRRNAGLDIIILPAQVQGDEAAAQIAARIEEVNMFGLAPVMIVGRGGGSVEDLLPFSDDLVIKAIHESEVPVISAVGHEVDWAISDFVADLRAPTPSAAAELVCLSGMEQLEKVNAIKSSMFETVRGKLRTVKTALEGVGTRASGRLVANRISNARFALDSHARELGSSIKTALSEKRHTLTVQKNIFNLVNPKAVLSRGYSIVSTLDGRTIRDSRDIEKGQSIRIRLGSGKAGAQVTEVENEV